MRFLVDAQLPRRLCDWLAGAGHDVKHTLDLPLKNRTPDSDILELAEREGRTVVTKDDDFVQSFLVSGRPSKLLLVTTGNISNSEIRELLGANLTAIEAAFEENQFVELGRETIAIRS